MGLTEDDRIHGLKRSLRSFSLPITVIAVSVLLAMGGETGREVLRYDREAIGNGEVWRLLSGHFAHLGWPHLALNSAGLLLVHYLVHPRFSTTQWSLLALLTIVGIDAGFWLFEPQLAWYVGLSGLLHGLLAAGAVAGILEGRKEAWLLAAVVGAKLAYEQIAGPVPGSEGPTGGDVIVAAHLYGGLAGSVLGALFSITVKRSTSI